MKKLLLVLLMVVLAMQATWAAGVGHCPPEGRDAPATAWHDHEVAANAGEHGREDHDHDDDGPSGSVPDCSVFHFVALEPFQAEAPVVSRAAMSVPLTDYETYESHVPEAPDRPRWRPAA